jgi:uncharacterized protein (DUF2336 family)
MVDLTPELLLQFAHEQSWTARAKIIERVASRFSQGAYPPAEHSLALDLFRIALYDSEPLVRRVLAESLKRAGDLPHDMVSRLAQDIPEVSAPFLAASPLLGDDELLPLATGGATVQRAAIACRPRLSPRVANILYRRTAVA